MTTFLSSCHSATAAATLASSRAVSERHKGIVMSDLEIHRGPGDVRSTEAFNEQHVSSPEVLAALKKDHPLFKGDWAALEVLAQSIDKNRARYHDANYQTASQSWNRFNSELQSEGICVHLEGLHFYHAALNNAFLGNAHLEGSDLRNAFLAGANLGGAHLDEANLSCAHLERTSLSHAHFAKSMLVGSRLNWAFLVATHFEGADLSGAYLNHAYLFNAHLDHANLKHAHFDRANLEGASLVGANLNRAQIAKVGNLERAVLDSANLRVFDYVPFDSNQIHRAYIPGDARDPWSILRRNYTGPWFFVHLILLIAFFTPYAAKAVYLSTVADVHEALENQAEVWSQDIEEYKWIHTRYEDYRQRFEATHQKTPAAWVLIGITSSWWSFLMAMVIMAYNAVRAYLTLVVSSLRDQEERSQVTPSRGDYMGKRRLPFVGRFKWFEEFRPMPSLHVLHRFAEVVVWIAVGFTLWNTLYWVFTKEVWVAN